MRRRARRYARDLMLVTVCAAVLAGLAAWGMSASRAFLAGILGLPEAESFGDLVRRIDKTTPPEPPRR